MPVLLGGNSDRALARVAVYGDGWYGFNLSMEDVPERIDYLTARCGEAGRDRASLNVAVSIRDRNTGRPQGPDRAGCRRGRRGGGASCRSRGRRTVGGVTGGRGRGVRLS